MEKLQMFVLKKFKEKLQTILIIIMSDDRIPLNVKLTEEKKELCDSSTSEIILYYLVNPGYFIREMYNYFFQ